MIGRVEVDHHHYEIEQMGDRVSIWRLDPTGKRSVRADANKLYNFKTGGWDKTEIERVVRRIERQGLFDKVYTSSQSKTGNQADYN